MIKNRIKLILNYEDNSIELYNLTNDIGERHNIASVSTGMAIAYRRVLEKWLKDNKAKFPIPNPAYNPDFVMGATAEREE